MNIIKDNIFAKVKNDLADIEDSLENNLKSHFDIVDKISRYIIFSGGKRIRSLVVLLSARICGYKGDDDKVCSIIFEFLHTATLLHDDLIDGASTRRGKPAANLVWGNSEAVLVGDYLLSQSLAIAVKTKKYALIKNIAEITEAMSLGELLQLQYKGKIDLSEKTYMDIIWRKTAVLFQGACRAGAIIADASDEKIEALAKYGQNIGIAFQMADDLLDYISSSETLGKKAGADLREGKITLPVIYAYKTADSKDKAIIRKIILNKDFSLKNFNVLTELLRKNNGITYTKKLADEYVTNAKDAISQFKGSETKKILEDIADFVILRKT